MKAAEFMKKAAMTLVMCVVFTASASDAAKFTAIEMENRGEPFQPGVTQREMARQGTLVMVIGQFETSFYDDAAMNDASALASASRAAYVFFLHPQAVQNDRLMSQDSKDKLQEWIDKTGPAGLKARAESRVRNDRVMMPQPNDFYGHSTPYFYLICEGDPVWTTDSSGRITGIDAEKTKFVGRPEDHAVLAFANDLLFDMNGMSAGRVIGGSTETPPGYMLWTMISGREGRFEKNPQGEVDYTYRVRDILNKYWSSRQGSGETPQETVELLYKARAWEVGATGVIGDFFRDRAKSVLESPTSNLRLNGDKIAA